MRPKPLCYRSQTCTGNHIGLSVTTCAIVILILSGCAGTAHIAQPQTADLNSTPQYAPARAPAPSDAVATHGSADVSDPEQVFAQGVVAYRTGDLNAAQQRFQHVLVRNPDHERSRYNLLMISLTRTYENLSKYLLSSTDSGRQVPLQKLLKAFDEFSDMTSTTAPN